VILGGNEVLAVGRTWPGATVPTGVTATADAVRTALATHDVVHLATHGRHDADNPLSDAVAARVMPRFHEHLRRTDDPEAALAAALVGEPEPAPLVCFGSLEGLER